MWPETRLKLTVALEEETREYLFKHFENKLVVSIVFSANTNSLSLTASKNSSKVHEHWSQLHLLKTRLISFYQDMIGCDDCDGIWIVQN